MLVFAAAFPNPSPFQLNVYMIVLALAAGGVGAVIPGTIGISYKSVRAGGALALVVMVYFFQPSIVAQSVKFIIPPTDPDPIARRYLKALEAGDIQDAWNQLDPVSRGRLVTDIEQLRKLYDVTIRPLGRRGEPTIVGVNTVESPSGYPVGLYRVLTYRTQFSNEKLCRLEHVTVRATQDLQWRVYANQIDPRPVDC